MRGCVVILAIFPLSTDASLSLDRGCANEGSKTRTKGAGQKSLVVEVHVPLIADEFVLVSSHFYSTLLGHSPPLSLRGQACHVPGWNVDTWISAGAA